ncbi:MAG: leucine-rich repeat domain-containing protein [Muribaculaceae bacterium]|nr:leucine-rich repeat domain-containing protein [Muribaculaceae bacterium]
MTEFNKSDLLQSFTDEYGVIYSQDRKRLLKATESDKIIDYKVAAGTLIICDGAFRGNESLRSIHIPDMVVEIGENTFEECRNLERVRMSNNLKEIKKGTFKGCDLLTEANIPAKLTLIGEEAFERCELLKHVDFPGTLFRIERGAFKGCFEITTLRFPASLLELRDEAFMKCFSLREVTFEGAAPKIAGNCFDNCSHLDKIYVKEEYKEGYKKNLPELKDIIQVKEEREKVTKIILEKEGEKGVSEERVPPPVPEPKPKPKPEPKPRPIPKKKPRSVNGWALVTILLLSFFAIGFLWFLFTDDEDYDQETYVEDVPVEEVSQSPQDEIGYLWNKYNSTPEGKVMQEVTNCFLTTVNKNWEQFGLEDLLSKNETPEFIEKVGIPALIRNMQIEYTPPVNLKPLFSQGLDSLYREMAIEYGDTVATEWDPLGQLNSSHVITIRNVDVWGNDSLAYVYYYPSAEAKEEKPYIMELKLEKNRWKIYEFIKDDNVSYAMMMTDAIDKAYVFNGPFIWRGRVESPDRKFPVSLTFYYEDGKITKGFYENPATDTFIRFQNLSFDENGYLVLKGSEGDTHLLMKVKELSDGRLDGKYISGSGREDQVWNVTLTPIDKGVRAPKLRLHPDINVPPDATMPE